MSGLRTAVVLGCAAGWSAFASVAEAQLSQRVDELVAMIQTQLEQDQALGGVRVTGGEVVPRRLTTGYDLRLVAEGGLLGQRVLASNAVRSIMLNDPAWRPWLEANGVVVTWYDVPADADLLTVVPSTSQEAAEIQDLLQAVQDQIELDPDLGGALVLSAAFAERPDDGRPGRELRIYGRVATPEQADLLTRAFLDAMAADPYWLERRGEVFVTLRTLAVAPPSAVLAQRYFVMGLDDFWDGRYLQADAAFMRAVVDAPTNPVYRYWRVVALLALGQDVRAEQKLRPLLVQNPWGQFSPVIAVAFERVQGPLRWRLQALEKHVLLTQVP
jgi:hypothetical protein